MAEGAIDDLIFSFFKNDGVLIFNGERMRSWRNAPYDFPETFATMSPSTT